MMGLPGRVRRLTIFSAVWIKYTNVTEGRTDGQTDRQTDREGRTPDDSKDTRLRIASRGKNDRTGKHVKHYLGPLVAAPNRRKGIHHTDALDKVGAICCTYA